MTAKASPLTVLLVEDDVDLASGLLEYMTRRGIVLEVATRVREARQRIREEIFDLILMDVQMPDGDGISLCETLKKEGLRTPILFLTARDQLGDKLRAFDAGAVDYVVKPFAAAELLARVAALTRHIPAVGGWSIRAGRYTLDHHSGVLTGPNGQATVSGPALAIIRRLMEASPGHLRRDALNAAIWGDSPPPSDPLRMHIYELRRTLEKAFGDSLIETVRGAGYRFVDRNVAD